MKSLNTLLTVLIFTLLLITGLTLSKQTFSQNKVEGWTPQTENHYFDSQKHEVSSLPLWQISPQQEALLQQMKDAKASSNLSRVQELQRELDALTGETVTLPANNAIGGNGGYAGQQVDNVINSLVFTNPSTTNIKAMATSIEQRGANTGRIWLALAYGTFANTTPDTLRLYYSDNGGYGWLWYSYYYFGGNAKVNNDQLDLEIMEYTTGQKYLWLMAGVTVNTGKSYAGFIVTQAPTFAFGIYTLNFPGDVSTNNSYMPRITSDNAFYSSSLSYNFMICGRDSLITGGAHVIGEKFAYCTSPFTISPTITYRGPCYYYNVNYGNSAHYDHVDIAYYRHSADSIVVSESNLPDSTYIYLMKDAEVPLSPSAFAALNWNLSYAKQFCRVVSNGSGPDIMLAFRQNWANSGDWDIVAGRSTGGGAPSPGWNFSFIDSYTSTTTVPWQPDLFGLRNTDSYKVTYVYFNVGLDSAKISSYSGGFWSAPVKVNIPGQDVSISASSHIVYRDVNGDSCLTFWSNYPGNNVWAAAGCTGPIVSGGINNNNNIAKVYSLSQNYPNPFNPTTMISFSIPKSGLVKLVVYDVLGQEVKTLVNEVKNTGTYSVSFDASSIPSGVYFYKITSGSFVSTKKMVLVK